MALPTARGRPIAHVSASRRCATGCTDAMDPHPTRVAPSERFWPRMARVPRPATLRVDRAHTTVRTGRRRDLSRCSSAPTGRTAPVSDTSPDERHAGGDGDAGARRHEGRGDRQIRRRVVDAQAARRGADQLRADEPGAASPARRPRRRCGTAGDPARPTWRRGGPVGRDHQRLHVDGERPPAGRHQRRRAARPPARRRAAPAPSRVRPGRSGASRTTRPRPPARTGSSRRPGPAARTGCLPRTTARRRPRARWSGARRGRPPS